LAASSCAYDVDVVAAVAACAVIVIHCRPGTTRRRTAAARSARMRAARIGAGVLILRSGCPTASIGAVGVLTQAAAA